MNVTIFLIAANVLVFLLQRAQGEVLLADFALWPIGDIYWQEIDRIVSFRPWQLVTSAFLHGSPTHLLLNMFGLYMFGREVEHELGSVRFTILYAAAVLTAGLAQLAIVSASGGAYPTVGASGGVFGVLLAFGVMFPTRMIVLLLPPIPMQAKYFVVLYGAIELFHGVVGTEEGVAHFAHLGGMLGAGIVLFAWRRRRAWRR